MEILVEIAVVFLFFGSYGFLVFIVCLKTQSVER